MKRSASLFDFAANLLNRCFDAVNFFSWFPPLLARLTVGCVFVESGWGKLHHLDKVIGFFTDLGLVAPSFQAHLVAGTEFICGTLVLIGLCTRFASVPLIVVMVVAILTAKRDDLHGYSDLIGFAEYCYIVLLIWLGIGGAGFFSVDAFLARRFRK